MKRIVLVGSIAVALPFKAGCCRLTHDVKRNEDVVRHFFENGINRGDVQSALLDLAEDTKNFGRPAGREGFRRVLEGCWVKRFSEEWSDRPPTYAAVENLAQREVEQRGRAMLDGYKQALTATPGVVSQDIASRIKQGLDTALLAEAEQVHAAIEYACTALPVTACLPVLHALLVRVCGC